MKRLRRKRANYWIGIAVTIAVATSAVSGVPPQESDASTLAEITNEFKQLPCKESERVPAVQALFERMGATSADINKTKSGSVENLVVRRKGQSDDTIIVGAHRDFVELGCGAVDNWSGIVAMAYLYRGIGSLGHKKNISFVAFDREERGLVGSRAMATAIKKEDLPQYCAMVNLDSFGLGHPVALERLSSPSLMTASQQISDSLSIPFSRTTIADADADSSSFLARKIPSITLSGLSDNWWSILHTTRDQKEIINPASVFAGYRLALSLLKQIDDSPCDAFR